MRINAFQASNIHARGAGTSACCLSTPARQIATPHAIAASNATNARAGNVTTAAKGSPNPALQRPPVRRISAAVTWPTISSADARIDNRAIRSAVGRPGSARLIAHCRHSQPGLLDFQRPEGHPRRRLGGVIAIRGRIRRSVFGLRPPARSAPAGRPCRPPAYSNPDR